MLSPGIWGKVKRPAPIMVQAPDENSQKVELEAPGRFGKMLLPPIDYLDGTLFTGKVAEYITAKSFI